MADLQLSRCHTCALEAKRLLRQHGHASAEVETIPEGDESEALEAACAAACSAACACAPSAADDNACQACVHQRGSSQENDAANTGSQGCEGPECAVEHACKALSAAQLGEAADAAAAAAQQLP